MAIKPMNNPELAKQLARQVISLGQGLSELLGRPPVLMEVCGTHTEAISSCGIRSLLKGALELRSGPGCPVCVTAQEDIDLMLALAHIPGVIAAVFGDMMRVPGSFSNLERERACGARVEVVYTPREAIRLARENFGKQVVLIAVGFETTAPLVSLSLMDAIGCGLSNFSLLSLQKTLEPVLHVLLKDADLEIDGFILPGHVAAITGSRAFYFLAEQYGKPAVASGFETMDILGSVYSLLRMLQSSSPRVVNGYTRVVREQGNLKAQALIDNCFYPEAAGWRGFGSIPASGFQLRPFFDQFDAGKKFKLTAAQPSLEKGCQCGEVLKGKITPVENAASRLKDRTGLSLVALSGGAWQNRYLLHATNQLLQTRGFKVLSQKQVPPNDGGIALGQAVIAACQNKV